MKHKIHILDSVSWDDIHHMIVFMWENVEFYKKKQNESK